MTSAASTNNFVAAIERGRSTRQGFYATIVPRDRALGLAWEKKPGFARQGTDILQTAHFGEIMYTLRRTDPVWPGNAIAMRNSVSGAAHA